MYIRKKTKKRQLTYEQKLFTVNEVRLNKRNRQDVSEELGIQINSLTGWLKLYREHGEDTLHSHYEKLDLIEHTEELNRLRVDLRQFFGHTKIKFFSSLVFYAAARHIFSNASGVK